MRFASIVIVLGLLVSGCATVQRGQQAPAEQASALVHELLANPAYDENTRGNLVDDLVRLGPAAVPALIEAIPASISEDRLYREVFAALGRIRDPRGVVPLLEVADKSVGEVGCATVEVWWSLDRFGDAAIAPCQKIIDETNHPLRWVAVDLLSRVAPARSVPYLCEFTYDTNCWRKERAARDLGIIGDVRGVAAVISVLQETNMVATDGAGAASALAEIGDARAVEPLIEAMTAGTRPPWARYTAARALGHLRDKRAFGPLVATLACTNREVRLGVIHALAEFGDPRAWDAIAGIATNATDALRDEALGSLLRLDGQRAAPLVTRAQLQPDQYRGNAIIGIAAFYRDPWATRLLLQGIAGGHGVNADAVAALADRLDDSILAAIADAMQYAEPYEVRATAAALMGAEESKRLAVLENASKSTNGLVRLAAVQTLGEIVGAPAVPRLLAALGDENAEVRKAAISALGHIGDSRGVEPLCKRVADKDRGCRTAAIEALGGMGDARAVQPLCEVLKDVDLSYEAAPALGELGDKRAVGPLTALLDHKESYVREAAASALAAIGGDEARAALAKTSCSAEVLAKLGDVRSVEPFLNKLRGLGPGSSMPSAGQRLGKVKDKRAVPLLVAALGPTNESVEVRVAAAEALGFMGHPEALDPLKTALLDPCDRVGSAAANSLRQLGAVGGYDELLKIAVGSDRRVGRERASAALEEIDDPAVVPRLVALLRPDVPRRAWLAAAKALGNCGDSSVCPALRPLLHDPEWPLVVAAAESLVKLGDAAGLDVLLGALGSKDWERMGLAVSALGRLRDSRSVQPMLSAIGDIRKCPYGSGDVLADLGDARAVPILIQMRDAVGVSVLYDDRQTGMAWNWVIKGVRDRLCTDCRDSIRARGALLAFVRKDRLLFGAVEPTQLEALPVVARGGGRYGWGPFEFDVRQKTFTVRPRGDASARVRGAFTVSDYHGRWAAAGSVFSILMPAP